MEGTTVRFFKKPIKLPTKDALEKILFVINCIFTMIMIVILGKYVGNGLKNTVNIIKFTALVLITLISVPGLGKVIFNKNGYGLFQRYVRWASAAAVWLIAQIVIAIVTWPKI